jgi:tetratricopeptide (TPR) repeat protein
MKKSFWTVALAFGLAQASQAQTIADGLRYLDQEQFGNARKTLQEFYTKNQTAEAAYYVGFFYLKTENADSAKIFFEKGIAFDAKYPLNHVGLGTVKYIDKNTTGATADFEQALTLTKRKNAEVMHRIAEAYIYYEPKNIEAALELLEGNPTKKMKGAKALAPQDAEIRLTTGDAYLERNDMSKQDGGSAANNYREALTIKPKFAKAYIRLGNIWVRSKNYQKAVEDYKKGIEIDPDYSPAYRYLGDLYTKFGPRFYKDGLQYYSEYMKRSDGNLETEFRYAGFLYLVKEYTKSTEILKKLESKLADRDNFYRLQAYNQYELKDFPTSLKYLEQLLKRLPADKLISSDFEYTGRLYLANGKDTLKAVEQIHKAAAMDTSKRALYGELFKTFWDGKAYKYAGIQKEMQIASTKKGTLNDYIQMGSAFFYGKDYVKADTAIAQANLIQETTLGTHWRARTIDKLSNDVKKGAAQKYWERYLELVDKNTTDDNEKKRLTDAYYSLAFLEANKNNDVKKTKEYAQKALEVNPDYKPAKDMLKKIEEAERGGGATNPPRREEKKEEKKQ